MRYLKIISCKIIRRKYTELSIHANTYLSILDTWEFSTPWLKLHSIKVSIERWRHCHVAYNIALLAVFQLVLNDFANNVFIQRF